MVYSHLYISFSYKSEGNNPTVEPFYLPPSGNFNGKNTYNFSQNINGVINDFIIYWNNTTWILERENPTNVLAATINSIYDNADFPGGIIEEEWIINPLLPTDLITFNSYLIESNTVESCFNWYAQYNDLFPSIWKDKVFFLISGNEGLYPGQVVTNLTFETTPIFQGIAPYHIGALLYTDATSTNYSTTYSSIFNNFVGIIILDNNNNYVIPIFNIEESNTGVICLDFPTPPTEEEEFIECYKKIVWSKQCKYSSEVLEYSQSLTYGTVCCNMLENLKQKRRILQILNCYDPRDILNNTMDYNTISYDIIKQLISKI